MKCTSNDKAEVMQLYQERLHGTGRKAGYHSPVHSAAMLLHPPHWDIDFPNMYGAEEYAKIRSDFVAVLEIVCKSEQEAMRALLQMITNTR